jgi:hypothetical protein
VSADNTYTEEEVVDLFLAAFTQTQNIQYMYVTQHFMSLRQSDAAVAFHDIEKRLMAIDETTERSCFVARKSRVASVLVAHALDDSAQTNAVQPRKIMCYNCGKDGHVAAKCHEPKHQQAHQASTGRQRGGRTQPSISGRGRGKGKQVQLANQSQAQPDTIVHGCSARVVDLSTTSSSTTYHSFNLSPIYLGADRL